MVGNRATQRTCVKVFVLLRIHHRILSFKNTLSHLHPIGTALRRLTLLFLYKSDLFVLKLDHNGFVDYYFLVEVSNIPLLLPQGVLLIDVLDL